MVSHTPGIGGTRDEILESVLYPGAWIVTVPTPTPIFRFFHIDNLETFLQRGALHAPNHTPEDGRGYRTIHNTQIQGKRHTRTVPCGPGGVIHDFVPFYFGYRSPMLFQLHSGRVEGYTEGQRPLIYAVCSAQQIAGAGIGFAFSDGHGIATFTSWYADLADLHHVDWTMVYQRYWADTVDDPDRQRRKQAEFLVHRECPWSCVSELVVYNQEMKSAVQAILNKYPSTKHRPINVRSAWYY